MRVSIDTVMQLPEEHRYILRTIWHPKVDDTFFLLNSLYEPSAVMTFGKHNNFQLSEERLNAYPLFTFEQMMKIIEDYGGYRLIKDVINKSTSINELFPLLWDTIVKILEDGESPEYWALTIPVTERKAIEFTDNTISL